jgi:oxalyl-CoA decarboxylase
LESSRQSELTSGVDLVIDALEANGVETIYGVVGIPVTDLARLAQSRGIRYIGFRHEASAGNAAAIAGFLTRRPGVCLTVSAPGFLNGLVSLAAATMNCFPMIQISGSSKRPIVDLQRGDYEELDQLSTARPLAKAAYRVDRPEDIGLGIARAVRTAVSGRPGGVYLDLPGAVLGATLDRAQAAASVFTVVDPAPAQLPDVASLSRAFDLLAGAQRPLIVLGKGAAYARADDAITRLIDRTGIPYLPMSMAKGLLPDDHPSSVAAARSLALSRADVVMLVGARLNWLLSNGEPPGWNPDARFIQVDVSATEFDSNRPIAAPVLGDIASVMAALRGMLDASPVTAPSAWIDELSAHKRENIAKMAARLAVDHSPMGFYGALRAVRDVVAEHPATYVVN